MPPGGLVGGHVRVRVPATSANLGPGFDSLGVALTLYDEVTAEVLADGPAVVLVEGEGAGQVPTDESHLVYASMLRGFAAMDVGPPAVRLRCRNNIPHGRGLGSSSAAIVAGIEVARALVVDGHQRLDREDVLALAADIEGHPDNVAPAVLGGLTVAWAEDGGHRAAPAGLAPDLGFVVFVPPDPVATTVARGLLPASVPHRDAAFNAGRAALLVTALAGTPELLASATEDRLHQEYRAPAMPDSAALIASLRAEGLAAVVSGAGPTVLVVGRAEQLGALPGRVPTGWRSHVLSADTGGVRSWVEGTGSSGT